MFDYIKKYKFAISFMIAILYLSFFKPQGNTFLSPIPYIDKIVHFFLYFSLSSVVWGEYLRAHKVAQIRLRRAFFFATLLPIFISGMIELGQGYLTSYRGAEWADFGANSLGSLLAAWLFAIIINYKRKSEKKGVI